MTRGQFRLALVTCAAAVGFSGAVIAQQSLLPPGFDDEKPAPSPSRPPRAQPSAASRPTPVAPVKPQAVATTAPAVSNTDTPVVQPLPAGVATPVSSGVARVDSLDDIDPALIDQLVQSATPKHDIPPQARRSLDRVGFLAEQDGGLPATSTHYLSGQFVSGVLGKMDGRLVSRWGHILLRRTLASRLDTPVGMNGADWAALRAALLLRMGEADAARDLVQSVYSGCYTRNLEDAALGAFLATADPVGICPVTALTAAGHPGWDWDLSRSICLAFTGGEGAPALGVDVGDRDARPGGVQRSRRGRAET